MSFEGNEKGDKAAKAAVEKASTARSIDIFASLTNIRCKILERKWKEAQH